MSVQEQLLKELIRRGLNEAELTKILSGVRGLEYEHGRMKRWIERYAHQRNVLLIPTKKDFKVKLDEAKKLEAELDLIVKELKLN